MEPLAFVHLDAEVAVADKPAGLLVHRTRPGAEEDALLQRVRDALGRRVYPVNRLDRMASGLVAYALDPALVPRLQAALAAPDARKEYLVLARGPCPAAFRSEAALVDDKGVARTARTDFERVEAFPSERAALLRARLHTGRGNQIRRHLALLGHHVLGDTHFGVARANRRAGARHGLARLFLHAWRLDVAHPTGGRLAVTAPLPPELAAVLASLRGSAGTSVASDAPPAYCAPGRGAP